MDRRAEVDRDTEIGVELLCDYALAALAKLGSMEAPALGRQQSRRVITLKR